jgi:hypothetical protein
MGFADTKNVNIQTGHGQLVISGSALADWELAHSSLQTVSTNALLNLGTATAYLNVIPIAVPQGCTRMWLRGAVSTDATTMTTDPIVVIVGADGNGIPERLDSADSNATGVTIDFQVAATTFTADSKLWTDVLGGDAGYDLKGNRTVYILVATAAVITDGTDPVTASAYVKFGN